jgi:hypothetical protein
MRPLQQILHLVAARNYVTNTVQLSDRDGLLYMNKRISSVCNKNLERMQILSYPVSSL